MLWNEITWRNNDAELRARAGFIIATKEFSRQQFLAIDIGISMDNYELYMRRLNVNQELHLRNARPAGLYNYSYQE